MVRNAQTLTGRARVVLATVLLAAVLPGAGCVTLDKRSWFSRSDAPPAGHMEAMWYKQVHYLPDPTRGGAATPAVVVRVYLFGDKTLGQPLTADGQLTVEMYDDTKPAGADGHKAETSVFAKDVLAQFLQKDGLGNGYSLLIPCRANLSQVHFAIRYEPAKGGTALFTSSGSITLEHGLQQPVVATQPTNLTIGH